MKDWSVPARTIFRNREPVRCMCARGVGLQAQANQLGGRGRSLLQGGHMHAS